MGIFDKLKNSSLLELIQDPRLRDLLTKREFRLSQEDLHREFVNQAEILLAQAELTFR